MRETRTEVNETKVDGGRLGWKTWKEAVRRGEGEGERDKEGKDMWARG